MKWKVMDTDAFYCVDADDEEEACREVACRIILKLKKQIADRTISDYFIAWKDEECEE